MKKLTTNKMIMASVGLAFVWVGCGLGEPGTISEPSIRLSEQSSAVLSCEPGDRLFHVDCEYDLYESKLSSDASITATIFNEYDEYYNLVVCEADKDHACACKWYLDRSTSTCGTGNYLAPGSDRCPRRLINGGIPADADIKWTPICEDDVDPMDCCLEYAGYADPECYDACSSADPSEHHNGADRQYCCEDKTTADGGIDDDADGSTGGD
jgi:hypothetical protein